MEEETQFPMAYLPKSSSKVRFLDQISQQESDSNPFELEESDVVWSSDFSSSPERDFTDPTSSAMSTVSNSPTNQLHGFRTQRFGLSAALSDDHLPLVRRKAALNASLSAVTAARTIPPVKIPPSGSSSENSSGPSSGKFPQSAPVNVPVWPKGNGAFRTSRMEYFDEEDEVDGEMLPPHEIVARSHTTTFSVFEGAGRTLKGRDLRRVRNAVWQKIGFQD